MDVFVMTLESLYAMNKAIVGVYASQEIATKAVVDRLSGPKRPDVKVTWDDYAMPGYWTFNDTETDQTFTLEQFELVDAWME